MLAEGIELATSLTGSLQAERSVLRHISVLPDGFRCEFAGGGREPEAVCERIGKSRNRPGRGRDKWVNIVWPVNG